METFEGILVTVGESIPPEVFNRACFVLCTNGTVLKNGHGHVGAIAPSRPLTLTERERQAENAMHREIERQRAEFDIVMVPKMSIPEGAHLVECYETEKEFVIIGQPESIEDENDPRFHNCDVMGCCTCSHVIRRIPKQQ